MTNPALRRILTAAIVLSLPAPILAQETPPTSKPDESIPKLELASDPAIERGKIAVVQGTAGPEGVRYTVGSLSILQPVDVMLLAKDESDDLTLSLFKKDWSQPQRTGSTRGSAIKEFVFRTEGGFNILIRGGSQPTPYALVVWAGEEGRPRLRDVVVTYDEFRKTNPGAAKSLPGGAGGGPGGMPIGVWIALAAVGAAAAAFVLVRAFGRRKQS